MKAPIVYMEKVAGPNVVKYHDPRRNEIGSKKLWKEYKKHQDIETDDTTKPIGYAFSMLNKSPLMQAAREETGVKDLMLDEVGNSEGVFHYRRT